MRCFLSYALLAKPIAEYGSSATGVRRIGVGILPAFHADAVRLATIVSRYDSSRPD